MIKISTDKSLLDVNTIYNFITQAYWAKGRTLKEVQKTIDNCLCFGAYLEGEQIGFARICTDIQCLPMLWMSLSYLIIEVMGIQNF